MTAKPTGVAVLRNATLFGLTRCAWGNYRKADRSKVTVSGHATDGSAATNESVGNRVNVTKKLIESPELDAVHEHMNKVYVWCKDRSMSSTAICKGKGIYFVKNDQVEIFEQTLTEARRVLHEEVVPAFLETYEQYKQAAKKPAAEGGLGDLYNEADYPSVEDLRKSFDLKWSWMQLSVPDELPDEIREREVQKLKDSFLEAQEEIKLALREGFKDLVAHAIDRLTPDADGKRKVFCESTFTKFTEFFETFSARNLMEDAELEAVVDQAKKIISGLSGVDDLRPHSPEWNRITGLIKQNQKKATLAQQAGDSVQYQRSIAKVAELERQLAEQEKADAKLLESTVAQFAKVDAILEPLVFTPTRRFTFE